MIEEIFIQELNLLSYLYFFAIGKQGLNICQLLRKFMPFLFFITHIYVNADKIHLQCPRQGLHHLLQVKIVNRSIAAMGASLKEEDGVNRPGEEHQGIHEEGTTASIAMSIHQTHQQIIHGDGDRAITRKTHYLILLEQSQGVRLCGIEQDRQPVRRSREGAQDDAERDEGLINIRYGHHQQDVQQSLLA